MSVEPADHEQTTVVPLQPGDVPRAGAVLGAAFEHDPQWRATISKPEETLETLVRMFTAVTRSTVAAGGVAETTAEVEAVALWLPPGREIGALAIVRSGFALPRFAMRMPSADRTKMLGVLRQLGTLQKELMPEPMWHLLALGVDPELQGRGLGSALVRAGIDRAAADAHPIYLETDTEENVEFYGRLGFEVLETVTVEAIAIPMWLMARPPAPSRP